MKLISTIITRVGVVLISFILLVINSNELGPEGIGTIALVILYVSAISISNEMFGGSALVYLANRYNNSNLYMMSLTWSLINILIFLGLFLIFDLLPGELVYSTLVIGLLASLVSVNNNILISKTHIIKYNGIQLLQNLIVLIGILIQFYLLQKISIYTYFTSLIIGYSSVWILSSLFIVKDLKRPDFKTFREVAKIQARMGLITQLANLFQLFNYRYNYIVIEKYGERDDLGKFSIATQISELAWLVGRSNALVKYSELSAQDYKIDIEKVLRNSRLIALFTLLVMIVFNSIPENWIGFVFGKGFEGIGVVILILTPGIVLLSANMVLSSYFAAIGKVHFNTIGSLIGLGATLILSPILVYQYNITGAAIACSIVYFVITFYFYFLFLKYNKLSISVLLFRKSDFQSLISNLFQKNFRHSQKDERL